MSKVHRRVSPQERPQEGGGGGAPASTYAEVYDVCVIGAGSGGLSAVTAATRMGRKTLLVEKDRVGGDCTWYGCVPSKAFIHTAKEVHSAKVGASKFGVQVDAKKNADIKKVMDYVQGKVHQVYEEETPEKLVDKYGLKIVQGAARFVDKKTIAVGKETYKAKYFIICVGGRALKPKMKGIDDVEYLTYESFWKLDTLPSNLIVVGAGPIGCELGQSTRRLGADVTMIANRILPQVDKAAQSVLETKFRAEGMKIEKGRATGVRKEGKDIVVTVTKDGQSWDVKGSHLLIAGGREPAVDTLNLGAIGVRLNPKGGIHVNKKCQTTVKNIFAAGDCLGGMQFTHLAAFHAFMATMNALLPFGQPALPPWVPHATFTDPEVAVAGWSEDEAKSKFGVGGVLTEFWPLSRIDRAQTDDVGDEGFIKIIYKKNGRLLGAVVVAPNAGEMIGELVLAITKKLKIKDVAGAIHPYPTYNFGFMQLFAEKELERVFSSSMGNVAKKISDFKLKFLS